MVFYEENWHFFTRKWVFSIVNEHFCGKKMVCWYENLHFYSENGQFSIGNEYF
jgi:hypothetical protein